MRCVKMKIIDILLFSFNVMAIKSATPSKDMSSQPVINGNLNKFLKDCPDLPIIIQNNNITEWTNCQNRSESSKVTEEEVLQFACFLARNMMMFIYSHKLPITNEYLSLPVKNPICPFQFSQLLKVGNLAKELTTEKQCNKVCNDLYALRVQCVILNKLNNFLKSCENQTSGLVLSLCNEEKSAVNTFIPRSDKTDEKPTEPKTSKETTTKGKMETTSNKDATSSVESVLTNETNKPKDEKPKLKKSESEKPNITPKSAGKLEENKDDFEIPDEEIKNSKIKSEYLEETLENDDMVNPSAFSPKSEVNGLTGQGNRWAGENKKVIESFNQKEINPNDGFLQAEDSHFFFYFIMVSSIIVVGYIGFHNKNKILAYALEGTSGRRSRRRPNPARYRKLETNLEEAISSNASETVASSVVY